jgi:hypothetical protein
MIFTEIQGHRPKEKRKKRSAMETYYKTKNLTPALKKV